MDEGIKDIHKKIAFFKHRYYLNLLIRGAILVPAIVLGYFLIVSILEYNLWMNRQTRLFILVLFFVLVAFCLFRFLLKPITWWINKKGLGEEESAKIIGNYFPAVADRLLNIIQLTTSSKKSLLLNASITQKAKQLQAVPFEKAVDLKKNKKFLRYLIVPLSVIIVLVFVNGNIFTKSAHRIVRFDQEFSPEAPFQFNFINKTLEAFFNEDFTLQVSLEGSAIPEAAYIVSGNQRWKMENTGSGKFEYTFEKIQNPVSFQIESSGFFSSLHKIEMINRPEITQLKIALRFPAYIGRRAEEITNAGNIEIPEGTKITWTIATTFASKAKISFSSIGPEEMQLIDNQYFIFSKNFNNPDQYSIILENQSSKNKDKISYSIDVIKDQYPEIIVENLQDSILYKSILLGGKISDDHGISELTLNYEREVSANESKKNSIKIPVSIGLEQQNFFYSWNTDSLHLSPGEKITYYFEVWDNDGVNGRKSTRSSLYTFALPSKEEMKSTISNQQESAENKIEKNLQKAKDLQQSIDEAQQKMRGKQSLDWQDKKLLEDLINQKQKLDQGIDNLQKENKLLEEKKEAFTEENERIKAKSEQLQKLMNELLDEETKKLFNELEKLLKENADLQQIQKVLDKMDRKEINLEKELERTLSLFKQLQYDYKLDQAINEIKSQADKQEKLLNRTEESSKEETDNGKSSKDNSPSDSLNSEKKANQDLAKDQEVIENETKDFEKSIDKLKELGKEIDQEEDKLPSKEDLEQLKNSEEQSKQSLEKGDSKKSSGDQKKSLKQMKQMEQQLQGMQSSMEMEIDTQNLESLRQIVHGLIKLSYDQENLMKGYNNIQQSDPKYVQISQQQLKLQDDSKVLEDSLLALSKKDPFMGSIVTREVGELNDHIGKAVENMKERRKGNAGVEMQFSMTNINNLALMLNDHFENMMNMMANAMPSKGKGKKGKGMPNLSKMQQQINDQIEQLKNGQKTGRQYSEELARMAAEQSRIRKALQEMQEKLKKEGGQIPGNDIGKKMEQTELDLVNKQITEQTIRRQKEILTRLLETEKSMREQNLDEERKGETAKEHHKEIPRAFEEYLRLKEKEVELLKPLPPKLFPYYKKEVNEYFKRIN
jgi:multisubunit Na+/H+ antiporter MnhB subunit